jgi:Fuc2NAc and GlcNAc transferase
MSYETVAVVWSLTAACAWALTSLVRTRALARQVVDVPNERSSHSVPTPRGGGVAIVVSFSLGVVGHRIGSDLSIDWPALAALLLSGLIVAAIGYIDDVRGVPSRMRLAVHVVSAGVFLVGLGGIPLVPVLGHEFDLLWLGPCLAMVFIVGSLNFFNFMDGIDGIASLQAITVSLGGALCWWLATGNDHWIVPVLLAACTAGFLVWNFPPARIFMGDSGSGFLGMALGGMALWAGHDHPPLFWAWFTLMGVFIVDPWVTLVRRMRRGGRFDEAHRSHAYQYAARRFGAHRPVSLAVAAINIVWLLPLALLISTGALDGVVGVLIGYAPLVLLAFRLKAGASDQQGALA